MFRKLFRKIAPTWFAQHQALWAAVASSKAQLVLVDNGKRSVCQIIHPNSGVVAQHHRVTAAWRMAVKNLRVTVRHVG